MNRFSPHRFALECLQSIKIHDKNAQRNAALSLPHHLRTHGLSATVCFGLDKDESVDRKSVTEAFVSALHLACPLAGTDIQAKAQTLQTEPEAAYLLHSRLALVLADGFALAARALWPTDEICKQSGTPSEASHA